MNITRWSTSKSDWLYYLQPKMKKLYTVSENKTRRWLWLWYELLIAKFRLKLKKVGKTTRPFRYDLNQITCDYAVGVRNRFKGLDLLECLKNYGQNFMTLYRRQWSRPYHRKRNAKRKNGWLRKPFRTNTQKRCSFHYRGLECKSRKSRNTWLLLLSCFSHVRLCATA